MSYLRFVIGFLSFVLDKIRMEYVWYRNRRANKKAFNQYMRVRKAKVVKLNKSD